MNSFWENENLTPQQSDYQDTTLRSKRLDNRSITTEKDVMPKLKEDIRQRFKTEMNNYEDHSHWDVEDHKLMEIKLGTMVGNIQERHFETDWDKKGKEKKIANSGSDLINMNELIFQNLQRKSDQTLSEELSEDEGLNSTIDIFHGLLLGQRRGMK